MARLTAAVGETVAGDWPTKSAFSCMRAHDTTRYDTPNLDGDQRCFFSFSLFFSSLFTRLILSVSLFPLWSCSRAGFARDSAAVATTKNLVFPHSNHHLLQKPGPAGFNAFCLLMQQSTAGREAAGPQEINASRAGSRIPFVSSRRVANAI